MAPPPVDNFRQKQKITTTIKNICQYYPPNTCLRELLQNADDAEATEIEYVLDTRHYDNNPVLADGLQGFQGPALLARNNSVFKDKDFASLSSIGDSVKANDPATTGKFGQGFNAVYHWTDGPCIYSRKWLLLLDPHEWWSHATGQAGGPRWDVIQNSDSVEIQNHLKTFNQFRLDHSKPLEQTIIRIPLRTAEQAAESEIYDKPIQTHEIETALTEFAQEIQEGGLLFLKHIRSVVIRIDSAEIFKASILETHGKDAGKRERLPTAFKRRYANDLTESSKDEHTYFDIAVKVSKPGEDKICRYAVSHVMLHSSNDAALDAWAREQKLFPWAAVAAPLNSEDKAPVGRLFTSLRLPMLTNLPIHAHGLFSIAPDRGRLSFTRDDGDNPTRWNTFMFSRCVALAWLKLLEHRSAKSWSQELFSFWPRVNSSSDPRSSELWDRIDDYVIDFILQSNSTVWNASNGRCLEFGDVLLAIEDAAAATYGSAMTACQVPAVYVNKALFRKVEERTAGLSRKMQMLCPESIRRFLRAKDLSSISEEAASLILEFCLLDAMDGKLKDDSRMEVYKGLQGIPLWPMLDGSKSQSGSLALLLPRNASEMHLFSKARAQITIDLNRLRPRVQELLLSDAQNLAVMLKNRGLDDLKADWPLMYPISPQPSSEDLVQRPSHLDQQLTNIWSWIIDRIAEGQHMDPGHTGSLWLMPADRGRIRRYLPGNERRPLLLIEDHEPLFDALIQMSSKTSESALPLLDQKLLPSKAIQFIRGNTVMRSEINCTCVNDTEKFVGWLVVGKRMMLDMSDQTRNALLYHLNHLTGDYGLSKKMSFDLKHKLRQLPLYSKVTSVSPHSKNVYTASSLDEGGHVYAAPKDLPPLPGMAGVSFWRPQSSTESQLIERIEGLENVSIEDLAVRHLVPWMNTVPTPVENHLNKAKWALASWLMAMSLPFSKSWQTDVLTQSVIPLPAQHGQRKYRCLQGMVDPESELAQLYDEKEGLFPCSDFLATHKEQLLAYGLLSKPLWSTPLDRARHLSQRQDRVDTVKIQIFLNLPVLPEFASSEASKAEIRALKWLPGTSLDGKSCLLAPNECRGLNDKHLVDMVLGIANVSIKTEKWNNILGWDQRLSHEILLKQLDGCLLSKDHQKAHRVLLEMRPEDCPALTSRSWVLGRSGSFFPPAKVFRPGSQLRLNSLAPYLDEIDYIFWKDHNKLLLALEVKQDPSLEELRAVQKDLINTTGDQLSVVGLETAVSILEIATHLEYDPTYLLIPDSASRYQAIGDIVHGEALGVSDRTGMNFTHPKISTDLAHRLGVESPLARAIRLDIDIESDEDEEDYIPNEKLETIISDTLDRYAIVDAFNEFLANADDAGATEIVWTLDECSEGPHAASSLLSPGLKASQGPALFVYNNATFTQEDFKGFKDIGQGGKKGDIIATGMFGRGALSMYHFTDTPMLVSNESFLILDPQRRVLPINPKPPRKRKVGMKMALSAINHRAADQLSSFVGLHGFNPDIGRYNGTIFRFPLRAAGGKSSLTETDQLVNTGRVKTLLDEYFATGRIALLFLRHVNRIEFRIRGQPYPQWSVSLKHYQKVDGLNLRIVQVKTTQNGLKKRIDTWCVGHRYITEIPSDIGRSGRGSEKITECGIAACLVEGQIVHQEDPLRDDTSTTTVGILRQHAIRQRVFCRLPTSHPTSLHVSIHASFAVTGDRRHIPLEASAPNATWNLWLLEDCLASLYLDTVQYMALRMGQEAFRFWPDAKSSNTFSGILGQAFWEKLGSPAYELHDVLPLLSASHPNKILNYETLLEPCEETTNVKSATFDFLSDHISRDLRLLLIRTIPFLVRLPKGKWSGFDAHFNEKSVKKINSESLCEVFKNEVHCNELEALISKTSSDREQHTIIRALLRTMIPKTYGEETKAWKVLDGCRIIPRLGSNLPLGILKWKPGPDEEYHFVAESQEEELFAYAANNMVHTHLFDTKSSTTPTEALFNSASDYNPIDVLLYLNEFNIRRLELTDWGPLLARQNSPLVSTTHSQDKDRWVLTFWRTLNLRLQSEHFGETIDELIQKARLHDQPIYRILRTQGWSYITPLEFNSGPYVLRPENDEHRNICEKIPGISMIDPFCAPFLLQERERDLSSAESFKRLLRVIQHLEGTTRISTTAMLNNTLSHTLKEVMYGLALKYVICKEYDSQTYNDVMKRLPIWRRLESSSRQPEHVAADDALFCGFEKMLMPWIKDRSKFVEPALIERDKNALSKLEVPVLTQEETWNMIKGDLPKDVKPKESREQYLEFIQYLARWKIKASGKTAPNGSSILCEPSTLYDHGDEIFRAAFREQQSTHFLHPSMQLASLQKFWKSLGLRVKSSDAISHDHYQECVLAVSRRWDYSSTSQNFEEDAGIVSSYLKYDKPDFQSWPTSLWSRLASIPMFKVQAVAAAEYNYRTQRMKVIANKQTHRALNDSSHVNHKRIVWSVTAFLREQPGTFVYNKLPRDGKPTVASVFSHLNFLVGMVKDVTQSDVPEFLRDVKACYDYLQENLPLTKQVPGIYKAPIWFNLDTTQVELASREELRSCITPSTLLCLNMVIDPLPRKAARKFLIPYEKLLLGLGCKAVTQPNAALPPESSDSRESTLVASIAKMRQLRDKNQLVDVYFKAEGQKKPAHKIVLAAVSEYCQKQFAGDWGPLLEHQATITLEDIRFSTLSQMIDFAYTGEFHWPELKNPEDNVEIGDTLEMLLDLLDGTDRWVLSRLHNLTENFLTSVPYCAIYIRPDTVDDVKERAEGARALRLVKYCDDFLASNEDVVKAMREDIKMEE